jgi:hypothetical protein
VEDDAHAILERVVDKLGMSARTCDRILKVARTIADLAQSKPVALLAQSFGFFDGSWRLCRAHLHLSRTERPGRGSTQ